MIQGKRPEITLLEGRAITPILTEQPQFFKLEPEKTDLLLKKEDPSKLRGGMYISFFMWSELLAKALKYASS